MRFKYFAILLIVFIVFSSFESEKINRKQVVQRHNVTLKQNNPEKPMQVGNGEFAYNVDITGMQTFDAHNTMAHWGFHNMPLPTGMHPDDFKGKIYNINGRPVEFEMDPAEQSQISKWLAANPHPINLGKIGLHLTHRNGSLAKISDIKNTRQHLDLWTGIITSSFVFDNVLVVIKTACHPKVDEIGIEINSALVAKGQLKIAVEFPYADDKEFSEFVGDYSSFQKHTSTTQKNKQQLFVQRHMDDLDYFLMITANNGLQYKYADSTKNPHQLFIIPTAKLTNFTFRFSQKNLKADAYQNENVFAASAAGWKKYWSSGAAIDFSACTDSRAFELERRIVLSQYSMKINNAGSMPPAETGLLKNSWYGKFHFEMIWWHGVHFALWNRWTELDGMLNVYTKFLPTSIQRAHKQGYAGARWPKATGNIDRQWPHIIHSFLIWQQPHPIYFAELDYRNHPTKQTLEKWKDVVFATADFMASYPVYDSVTRRYNLNAPLFIASENTNPDSTNNPAFELSYWRFGLRTAAEWRRRLQMPEDVKWNSVLRNLAPLPVEDKKYVTHEGIKDMWTKYNYEHPCLIATYGMLPGDGVDEAILTNTYTQVLKTWDFDRTWGWDFPMVAMTAAKLNKPETAIDMLLFENKHNSYDSLGYNSWIYFPANGGLLSAIAMMAGGWDGGPAGYAPGFPKNGKWNVKVEGFRKML